VKITLAIVATLVFAALALLTAKIQAANEVVDEIVEKTIAARGGAQKLKAIQSERVTGRIIPGRGDAGRFVVELKRPLKMRMEMIRNGKTITRIYDGQSGGWVVNLAEGKTEPVPMTVNDIKNIQKEADFDGPLLDYKKKENKVELVGKERIDGKSVYKLRVALKDSDTRYYYFSATSFLLVKWEGTRIEDGKDVAVESFFHDYRDVQGVKFAFEIVSRTRGANSTQKVVLEKIELNPELDDSRFSKPETAAAARVRFECKLLECVVSGILAR
jgi:outer membrane lipoprotein-sorting protein